MQPIMVALPFAGIAPITGYCGPGPERTLSGVIAEATTAAEAVGANSGLWRRLQTGNVQHYAVSMLLGALAILGYYAWR